jgi:hypothetical protein
MPPRRPSRGWLRGAAAALLGVAAIGLLLEATVRVFLFGPAGLVPSRINSVRALNQTGFLRPSPHPRIGFELAPNLDGWFKLVPFRTGSRGLRDDELPLAKPPDTFRVAVLGSSFALPAGVAIEDAFHTRLERQLSDRGGLRYEFINFSVGGYSPEQMLATLELRALDYEPDLVLFTTTRFSAPKMVTLAPGLSPRPRTVRKSYPFFQSFFWRLVKLRSGAAKKAGITVGRLESVVMDIAARFCEGARPVELGLGRRRSGSRSILERLAAIRDRTGVSVAVVRLEFDMRARESERSRRVPATCRSLDLPCHDTRDRFEGTRARDFWIHPLDEHPNAAAQARFAASIAEFLRANALIPAPAASPR